MTGLRWTRAFAVPFALLAVLLAATAARSGLPVAWALAVLYALQAAQLGWWTPRVMARQRGRRQAAARRNREPR